MILVAGRWVTGRMATYAGEPAVCSLCGTPLVRWQVAKPGDPQMDCAGDCLACMTEIENELGMAA